MEDKVLKQIKTSCAFPLLIYKTTIKYNEVKKASGIAFILLDLIQKEENWNERLSDVLLKLGIPSEMHYIFGQEIASLIDIGVLNSVYKQEHFVNPKYFRQILTGEIELTTKGIKMFKDGAIPTGEEKAKVKDIYFSPVTRKFDVESKVPYMPLASSYLGEGFMDKVEVDISGMEDYLNANSTKIGLKAEEKIVSFECDVPQKMHTRKEEGVTILIKPSGVEFKFDTSDETDFFNKYYTSKLMGEGLLVKNKYKFVNSKKEQIQVPTLPISELDDLSNVYIPDDAQKQASRPCIFFFNRGKLGVKGIDSSIKLESNDSVSILDEVDNYAEFALLDKSGLRYYCPLNVTMPCKQLGDAFDMQLLIERNADNEKLREILRRLFMTYLNNTFTPESGKGVLFLANSLGENSFDKYADAQLSRVSSYDEKINLLLRMNSSFKNNVAWNEYFLKEGKQLLENSASEIRLDNMIYKNTILAPLKNELCVSSLDYIRLFVQPVIEEDKDLVYEALETAGFKTEEILSVVNVIDGYMNKILKNETIYSNANLADKFKNVSLNLWKINMMLGIEDSSQFTIKDDFNVDDFFDSYVTLIDENNFIEKFSRYSPDKFAILRKYLEIFKPIHELLAIEREASSHPDKITRKYIDDNIARGRFKNAICDLSVKLQYDLRKRLDPNDTLESFELINLAKEKGMIDEGKCSSLHKMRKIRNGFQHPEREQIQYTEDDIKKWKDIVFEIGGKNNEPTGSN